MTLEESKEILKDWVRLDLEALDGDTESDYAKFVLEQAEAIEVVLEALAEQEDPMQAIYVCSPYRGDISKNTKFAAEC